LGIADLTWDDGWMFPRFVRLNLAWNAVPNTPDPKTRIDGEDLLLVFNVNSFQFPEFRLGERGVLRFVNCSRFRLGATNDEGWYLGHCRFTGLAPAWGEFYAVIGDPGSVAGPDDWVVIRSNPGLKGTHFLFYFRDSTFESVSEACMVEPVQENALFRTGKSIACI
jgi:hypothetical protein